MSSGGGGGSWNPFESPILGGGSFNPFQDVSANKPFGDSTASTLVGGNGGLNSIFNGVSMTDPMGRDSTLAGATGHKDTPLTSAGVDKKTGQQVSQPTVSVQNGGIGAGIPTYGGGSSSSSPGSSFITPTPAHPLALSSLASPSNTGAEDALRQSYLNSLKPNYGFTFAGQQAPGQFSAVPGAKK